MTKKEQQNSEVSEFFMSNQNFQLLIRVERCCCDLLFKCITDKFSLSSLELARDALHLKGFHVLGGYMSPVNDAYKKEV